MMNNLQPNCKESFKSIPVRELALLASAWQLDRLEFYYLDYKDGSYRFRALSMLRGMDRSINLYFILDTGGGVNTVIAGLSYPTSHVYLKPDAGELLKLLVEWEHEVAAVLWRQYKIDSLLA